jgi:flagellin-like protein
MNIKAFLFDDDRGVSPVIGVILMVAITVILAAVIAAFVLGLGDTNSTAPSVTFDYDYDQTTDNVTVTMTGGESFDPARVEFQADGTDVAQSSGTSDNSGFPVGASTDASDSLTNNDVVQENSMNDDNTVSAGDSITLALDGDPGTNGGTDDFELSVIFTSEDGGTSSEIGGTTGPNA